MIAATESNRIAHRNVDCVVEPVPLSQAPEEDIREVAVVDRNLYRRPEKGLGEAPQRSATVDDIQQLSPAIDTRLAKRLQIGLRDEAAQRISVEDVVRQTAGAVENF